MTRQQIHGRFSTVTASLLLQTLGDSLDAIRREDGANDADIGAVLGKSKDSAERYRNAEGEMGVIAFLRGCRAWDGRFANSVLSLLGMKLVELDAEQVDDQASVTTLLALAMSLSAELEKDGDVSDADLRKHRAIIERVGGIIDGYRERLRTPPALSAI